MAERVDEALRVAGRLVALAALVAVVFFGLGVVLKPLLPDGLPPGIEGRQFYLTLVVVALGIAHVVMVAVAEKGEWRLTGLGRESWSPRAIASGLGLGLAIAASTALIGHYAGSRTGALTWVLPTTVVLLLSLVSTLVDALMLRGYTIGIIASKWGDAPAVALTALVATLLALRIEAPTPLVVLDAFMMASFLGILRLRTGSLAAAWLAHLGAEVVLESLGTAPLPGVTAGLLAMVTFLLFRLRPKTSRPGRA